MRNLLEGLSLLPASCLLLTAFLIIEAMFPGDRWYRHRAVLEDGIQLDYKRERQAEE